MLFLVSLVPRLLLPSAREKPGDEASFWWRLEILKLRGNFLFIGLEDYCRRLGEEEELSSLSSGEKKEMRNTLKVITRPSV